MAEVAKKTETPKAAAPAKPDPNAVNVAPKVEPELTVEEKKAKAEFERLDTEGQEKASKINARLTESGSAERVQHQVRNGELVYMYVNLVPTRIFTEDELKAAAAVR